MEQIFVEGFTFWTKLFLDFFMSIPYWFYIIGLVVLIKLLFNFGKKNI